MDIRPISTNPSATEALIKCIPGMVYHLTNDGIWTISYASEGAMALLGNVAWKKIQTGRACLANLVHTDSYPHVLNTLDAAFARRNGYSMTYRINSLIGETMWVHDTGEGVYDGSGNLTGVVGVLRPCPAEEIPVTSHRTDDSGRFQGIIGGTPEMLAVFDLVDLAAHSDSNVIIQGESGTGKELVSKAIHDKSPRSEKPFVPVNCGAIPETLVESEFFGHRKGAFSGADRNHTGILERADGGTLFLDEIGEIPLTMQTKLLRALEGGGFTPVGGHKIIRPNLRIIAATNRDLGALVREGKMRADFYYRIHVIPILLPALKTRRDDIPLLANHFLSRHADAPPLSPRDLARLMAHHWPGNVRELDNVLRSFAALRRLELPTAKQPHQVPELPSTGETGSLKDRLDSVEEAILREVLLQTAFNRTKAARVLGIDRRSLYTKMQKHGIGA